jgi:hypothetical protein
MVFLSDSDCGLLCVRGGGLGWFWLWIENPHWVWLVSNQSTPLLGTQLHFQFLPNSVISTTGCRSLVIVLSLSKWEVVSSRPARAGRVKPKTHKIGSDCFFAKSTAFRSENDESWATSIHTRVRTRRYSSYNRTERVSTLLWRIMTFELYPTNPAYKEG